MTRVDKSAPNTPIPPDAAPKWSKSLPKLISFRLICNTLWGDADITLYLSGFPTTHHPQMHQKSCPMDKVDGISLASGRWSVPAALIRPQHVREGFGWRNRAAGLVGGHRSPRLSQLWRWISNLRSGHDAETLALRPPSPPPAPRNLSHPFIS